MAIRKSDLYRSLWSGCDDLRGGMDPSQYKDYVLVMLFVKYVSDKYAGKPFAPIAVPQGASFNDLVALKGQKDIGDQINKRIIAPLFSDNKLSGAPDFNDSIKLGHGKEMVDRLSNLIAIFEAPALDFSNNRAADDDLLGDAYEYLMRHFASESGKSKGQFYTPAEVSRVMAQIVGIQQVPTASNTTVYDPTCGSGSLLLKVGDAASTKVTLYGQEKDAATAGLAHMNMILHDQPTASIKQGNTLTSPLFTQDEGRLKTFDYVVANPPFSDKRWGTGLTPQEDPYQRFTPYGVPPAKQGDYAYLLHILGSLNRCGKGACILPHGVLFRGNAEAEIRRNLIRRGLIKGIIGLPANLFYGTGIPACIILIDKDGAAARKGIFMLDAAKGFAKDGNKNRLREQDIHRIAVVFTKRIEVPQYSRMVSVGEIEQNAFNLNLPRYIDSQTPEDSQDIAGHLRGGIPTADIAALEHYWRVFPKLRRVLFAELRPGYVRLAIDPAAIKETLYQHPEFLTFSAAVKALFHRWRCTACHQLKGLAAGLKPKALIAHLGEGILNHYRDAPLMDNYAIYQHLMDYWNATLQDDIYLIAADGWQATPQRLTESDKKGRQKDPGWACDLVPKGLIIACYFDREAAVLSELQEKLESASATRIALEEAHSGEEGLFAALEKPNKSAANKRLREIKGDPDAADESEALQNWLAAAATEADFKQCLSKIEKTLDAKAYAKYPQLSEDEVKTLVVDDKWLAVLESAIDGEFERISQALSARVQTLAERYATPLPEAVRRVEALQQRVNQHLQRMGFAWH